MGGPNLGSDIHKQYINQSPIKADMGCPTHQVKANHQAKLITKKTNHQAKANHQAKLFTKQKLTTKLS